ncbi:MAG: LysR family transcriptional regulator [Gemmataceae bacterium]
MQLEALKVFCDLATLRNFSRTAKANDLSQPTVTRLVRRLEKRLGGPLIDRTTRPLKLTDLGREYHAGCKRLLEQYTELEASLRRGQAEVARTVRVAAIYSVGLWDMGQYVGRFAERYPGARVHIDYLHPKQVYERVLDGSADLGLVSYPARTRELDVLPWREEEMVVACPPGHAFARLRRIDPRQLDGERFVAFDRELVIRRKVDRFLRDHAAAVEVTAEFDNIENIKKGIDAGAGIGLLPEPMLRQEIRAGTLKAVRLAGCRLMRPLGIIHRHKQPLGQATQGFVELLRGPEALSNGHPPANGKATARRARTTR